MNSGNGIRFPQPNFQNSEAKEIQRVVDSHLFTATIVLQLEFLNHFAIDKSPSVIP